MVINPFQSLHYTNTQFFHAAGEAMDAKLVKDELEKGCVYDVVKQAAKDDDAPFTTQRFILYNQKKAPNHANIDFRASVGMGFFFPESQDVYGLPQRKYDFKLPTTEKSGPYRLFN